MNTISNQDKEEGDKDREGTSSNIGVVWGGAAGGAVDM
jgi:hypothetical protein